MKKQLLRYGKFTLLSLASCIMLLTSCSKDETQESTAGVYVLSEGSYGKGNSDITYYNINTKTAEKGYYKKVNGTDLGETGNDLQRYGSKMYCVVSGVEGGLKSFVDVMDVKTCKTIKRIPFNWVANSLPRNIAFYQNKAYVSRYDGKVSRIDTASLQVDGEVNLEAPYLEGLAVANGKLYVANSDFKLKGVDKVSVIDLKTFTKTKDITVAQNPTKIIANNGDIFVISLGNYDDVHGALNKINTTTDTKVEIKNIEGIDYNSSLAIVGLKGYLSVTNATTFASEIKAFAPTTAAIGNNFITDGTSVGLLYSLSIDPFTNGVLVGDAISYTSTVGNAHFYNANGVKQFSFETAINPKAAVFNYVNQ